MASSSSGAAASPAGRTAITQVVDASAALATLQQIERNAQTIGNDTASLLGGLQSALQSLSHNSVDYMTVYRDSAANMSTAVGNSVGQGRSFIDECVKLDARMADLNALAVQVRGVNEALTGLEAALGLNNDAPAAPGT